ncbi:hypothetical protein [Taklimakanibacter deserti]|uniref:hypothetical protein n=1 Tax=Taklimakanibacter deserti TaxID=2267839 RepID=UPI000E65D833
MKTVIEGREAESGGHIAHAGAPLVVLFAASPHGAANVSSVVLGQHPRVFPTGELKEFPYGRQINEGKLCSCKSDSTACSFWRAVQDRYAPFVGLPRDEKVPHLYRIIAEESGRDIIADVAHDPDRAEQLSRNPRLNLRLVHVLKDGQAIVNARLRHRNLGLQYAGWRRLDRTVKATRRWRQHVSRLRDLEAELGPRAMSLDYKLLCENPAESLAKLGTFLSLDLTPIAAKIASGEPLSSAPHQLRGSDKLMGNVMIRYDDRYRRQMSYLEALAFRLTMALT